MATENQVEELYEQLDAQSKAIRAAIAVCVKTADMAKKMGPPYASMGRRIDAYTIGWLKAFVGDLNQLGSVESLRRELDDFEKDRKEEAAQEAADQKEADEVAEDKRHAELPGWIAKACGEHVKG